MAVFKCKMCGGELNLQPGVNIAECSYCLTKQTVPYLDDDKRTRLYNRANQYRLDSEFDKAYSAYETIIAEKEDEAEAYWGLVLSEYGVEYVDDPATGKKIPTCHRTLIKSVTSNENFKRACQYAEGENRMMYEDEAEELDSLQKKILTVSSKEAPYDVFICYKESDVNGERTADSVLAQDIYNELTRSGLRVFFSRISLEDKLGKDYEPYIFAALTSAKVMLMVTTDSDHCNAVWVKNEWKRYLDFMKTDKDKVLIPVYKDISPYALPDEFAKLQAQDMSKLGAVQDLVHAVEKMVAGKPVVSALSQREQELLDKLEKSQRRTKWTLRLLAVVAAVAAVAFGAYTAWDNINWDKLHLEKAEVGDIVTFGSYEQDADDTNGKEAIEWIVLEKNDNKLLVISKYILDVRETNVFGTSSGTTTTEWLNQTFASTAFDANDARALMQHSMVVATHEVSDKVLLLSSPKAEQYFPEAQDRIATPTAYAQHKVQLATDETVRADRWWVYKWNARAYVDEEGKLVSPAISREQYGIRPVIRIDCALLES